MIHKALRLSHCLHFHEDSDQVRPLPPLIFYIWRAMLNCQYYNQRNAIDFAKNTFSGQNRCALLRGFFKGNVQLRPENSVRFR